MENDTLGAELCRFWFYWRLLIRRFIVVCVCVPRAMVCVYVSAYVGGLGSGTPEYTRWNVKCVCFEQPEGEECLPNSL